MWDLGQNEDKYARNIIKTHNQIAKEIGWDDYDHMMLNEGEITSKLKIAINLLCASYGVTKIFK